MPERTLSDDQAHSIAGLFYKLCQDPKTRKSAARLIRESGFDPALARQFTDVELEDRLEEERQRRENEEHKRRSDELVQTQARKRASLLAPGDDGKPRYTEDQVKEIESLMEKHGIADYDTGTVLYKGLAPAPNPDPVPPPGERIGATWEFPSVGNLSFADFAKDPTKAARDVAYSTISEFRRGRRAA